ncbi:MAG TPA: hypothetical protein VER03_22950, partial [Bryobacteraceae bacterium]|nr:hypothetical protein [Bryobacteraceae bacterium]
RGKVTKNSETNDTFRTKLALGAAALVAIASPLFAQVNLGPVTVGAGMRTAYIHTDTEGGSSTNRFPLESVRLYVNGPVTETIKFMFNTEYNSATNEVNVLDAAARFEFNPKFNIWAGRLLPPSDRANLAGPYFNNHWGVYQDGIQNGHPFIFQGRDNGVVYWGDFAKKIKISAGAFDGQTATGRPEVIGAARVQIDFWDAEEGYYLNSTYYGAKNLLAIAGATQVQSGNTATTVDFLMERKLGNAGVVTIESEYANYNGLGGYDPRYRKSQGAYLLGAYILPQAMGPGRLQLLGKYAKADFTQGLAPSYNQKTTEINVNYLVKEFNARIMTFYRDVNFNRGRPDSWQIGVGLQIQM